MKHTATVLLMTIVAITLTCAAFAENLRSIPVELTLGGDVTTSFEVYADAGSTTPLSELTLSDGGYTINDNVKYIAGEAYLNITYGNTGKWHLLIYTSNDIADPYMGWPSFLPTQANHLLSTDGSCASLLWKYNNPRILDPENRPVGSIISAEEWAGQYFDEYRDPMYIYMHNFTDGNVDPQASFISYYDHEYNSNIPLSYPIRITFGVDLGSSCRATTYTSTLNFEVYYE